MNKKTARILDVFEKIVDVLEKASACGAGSPGAPGFAQQNTCNRHSGGASKPAGGSVSDAADSRQYLDSFGDYSNVRAISSQINNGNPAPSPKEIARIKKYTGHDFKKKPVYRRINESLRSGAELSQPDQDVVDAMDSAIKKNPAQIDAVVYRSISRKESEPQLPSMGVGDVFEDAAYVSTSTDWTVGSDFQSIGKSEHRMLKIKIKKGQPALAVSKLLKDGPTENEVILPRGTRFRVTSLDEVDLPHRGRSKVYSIEIVD